jgi:hypothetical protein
VTVNDSCGTTVRTVNVKVSPVLSLATTLDDFEAQRRLSYTTVSGSFTQNAANPGADAVNSSAVVARYVRNSTQVYDVLTAGTSAVPDAGAWLKGTQAFYMDVYTDAPVGTPMLLQLENSNVATPSNFPAGRHSKYHASTTRQNGWQRLKFLLEDRLDDATADTSVNQMVLLLNPGTNTANTYWLDNLSTYSAAAAPAGAMHVSSVTTGTAAAGGGKKKATATVTVLDSNNAPVAGATVTGNFSGTLAQTGATGTTDSTGKATLSTTASASGTLVVNFCVSNVAKSGQTYDKAGSVGTCP